MENRFLSRGKRIDNGEWIQGYLYGIWERRYILWGMINDIPNMAEVDPEYGITKEQFAWLWESTIKKSDLDRYGWNANPWVWVIEFERCEKPEGV